MAEVGNFRGLQAANKRKTFALLALFGALMWVVVYAALTYFGGSTAFIVPIAVALSLAILPSAIAIPKLPENIFEILFLIFGEIFVGLLIGSITKILTSAIHVAGNIIAMQSSLSQASLFDPNMGSQGTVIGGFMEVSALVLIFALDLHHLLIQGIAQTYEIFTPGAPLALADFSESAARAVSKSFAVGVQLSAPLIIVGILLNLASGILARLMPSFQVFFVIMPAQILISIFIFMATFSAIMLYYMEYLGNSYQNFITP